jgi:hypothetical protein
MNTKDREYMENLNNSIAEVNKNLVLLAKKLSEMESSWEDSIENLRKAFAGLELKPVEIIKQTIQQSVPANEINYNGWEEETKEELHPMIENNKFVDDGSLFQDEEDATPNLTPSPRRRNGWESNLVSVTCAKCGKTEKINKLHATGTMYSCGRCTRR